MELVRLVACIEHHQLVVHQINSLTGRRREVTNVFDGVDTAIAAVLTFLMMDVSTVGWASWKPR